MSTTLAVATVGAVVAPTAAHAAFPGRDGRLAYLSDRQLVTASLRGSTLQERVLPTPARPVSLAWNPYGTRIAYADLAGSLRTVTADGRQTTSVYLTSTTLPQASAPTWAPKGAGRARLAFVLTPRTGPAAGRGDVWVVPVQDGRVDGARTRLTRDGAAGCGVRDPEWSPDGRRLAYVRSVPTTPGSCAPGTTRSELVLRDLAGGRVDVLPAYDDEGGFGAPEQLDWAPDGRSLVGLLSSDCATDVARYTLATRGWERLSGGSRCGTDQAVESVAATPSGGVAVADATPTSGGTSSCVTAPSGHACRTGRGFAHLDVQALAG